MMCLVGLTVYISSFSYIEAGLMKQALSCSEAKFPWRNWEVCYFLIWIPTKILKIINLFFLKRKIEDINSRINYLYIFIS